MIVKYRGKARKIPDIPLFERFTLEQLVKLVPYSVHYLRDIQYGRQPARPRFKRTVCDYLKLSEYELFNPPP